MDANGEDEGGWMQAVFVSVSASERRLRVAVSRRLNFA
jgi:hypothetical protein